MNSRSGMSTPVESMSTVTTTPGLGRLRNSRMRWSGPVYRLGAGDLLNERVTLPKHIPCYINQLVRMRRMRQVVCGKDQYLREAAVPRFMV